VEEEEGIRFTGLLLGRDRRTGLVFLECGVDGNSTSTPRMLHVLLVRVVALNAATAIAPLLLLLLPHSLFKKTSTLTKTTSRTFPNQKQKQKTTSRKRPKNLPKNLPTKSTTKIRTNSLTHKKKLVICT
jgi:succinylglutamate desuccinylase